MRGYLTFFVIAVMSLGLVFLLVTRARTPHDAPAEVVEIKAGPDGGLGDGGADGGALDASALADAAAVDAAPPKPAERAIRVAALGWELVAPGAALASPDGGAANGSSIELAPESTLEAVEARLARGGDDPAGADVAILPLPAFVAAYERLRALDPRAFAVVGWSRGREEMHATPGSLLKAPPTTDEVKLVALGPGMGGDAAARAAGTESATLLGLFSLDLVGVAPARLRLIAPGSADGKGAPFAAVVKGAADERKLALSTADASRLVPIVIVAPKAELDKNEAKMRDFARAWLDGIDRTSKDASNVARRLANKESLPLAAGVGGAPEALALLERLGQIEPASLASQGTWIGPGARGAVSLVTLTQHTWQLSRAAGLTTSGAPDPLPIDARVVAAIAPAAAPAPSATSTDAGAADAGAVVFAALPSKAAPLLVYRAVDTQADVASVSAEIGFLAGVFEHAAFRVTAKGGEKAARAIAAAAQERFELPPTRLSTTAGEPAGAFATVEVLALP